MLYYSTIFVYVVIRFIFFFNLLRLQPELTAPSIQEQEVTQSKEKQKVNGFCSVYLMAEREKSPRDDPTVLNYFISLLQI